MNKAVALITCVLLLTVMSCKRTYYDYDIKKIEKAAAPHGGVNRFHSDMNDIIIICKDGEMVRLN